MWQWGKGWGAHGVWEEESWDPNLAGSSGDAAMTLFGIFEDQLKLSVRRAPQPPLEGRLGSERLSPMVEQLDPKETSRTKVGLTGLGPDGTLGVKGVTPEVRSLGRESHGGFPEGGPTEAEGDPEN